MDLKQMREKYIKEGYEIFVSTRYKDIFDFYYLINNENLNKNKKLCNRCDYKVCNWLRE